MDKQTLDGPNGLKIDLDKTQVFKDDPGAGTPAIVRRKIGHKEYTATYNCACGTGELDGDRDGMLQLNDEDLKWLNSKEDEIGEFLQW